MRVLAASLKKFIRNCPKGVRTLMILRPILAMTSVYLPNPPNHNNKYQLFINEVAWSITLSRSSM